MTGNCRALAQLEDEPGYLQINDQDAERLGIEENGLTLCPICHRKYDQTTARMDMRAYFREYLMGKYENWSEDKLIYRKDGSE